MKTHVECLPCFVRQANEAIRMATADGSIQERVLRQVMRWIADAPLGQTPCILRWRIYRFIREAVGEDPYISIKTRCNHFAMGIVPLLENWVNRSPDPIGAAIRLAIAANETDFGIHGYVEESHVLSALDHTVDWRIQPEHLVEFRKNIENSSSILYLADNAGELAIDQVLLRLLPNSKVTVVVKGGPIVNDATLQDARMVGVTEWANVIDTGSDAPGLILESCSASFRRVFEEADLIIAKGHAHYETLSELNKNSYFLFKVKCPVIGSEIGVSEGTHVFLRGNHIIDSSFESLEINDRPLLIT